MPRYRTDRAATCDVAAELLDAAPAAGAPSSTRSRRPRRHAGALCHGLDLALVDVALADVARLPRLVRALPREAPPE